MKQINQDKSLWLIFGLFLLAGIALRFFHLGAKSLWDDEIITVQIASNDLSQIYNVLTTTTNSPPLFHWTIHFLLGLGQVEFWTRLPSAIFGALSLWIVYQLERELFGSRYSALLAMGLAAVSPLLIYYSQEARGYSMWAFWQLLSYYSLLRLLKLPAKKTYGLVYLVSVVLSLYTHYFAAFHLVAQGLIAMGSLLVRRERQLKEWLKFPFLWALSIILSIPVVLLAARGDPNHGKGLQLQDLNASLIWENLKDFRAIIFGMNGLFVHPLAYILFFLFCLGVIYSLRRGIFQTLFLLIWLFVPFYLGVLFLVGRSFFHIRYFIPVAFPYLIFAARGVLALMMAAAWGLRIISNRLNHAAVVDKIGPLVIPSLAVLSVFLVTLPAVQPLREYYALEKQDYLGSKQYILTNMLPGDAIVYDGHAVPWFDYYYADLQNSVYTPRSVEALDALGANCRRVWFVYTWENLVDYFTPGFVEWSQQERFEHITLPGERNVYVILAGPKTEQQVNDLLETSLSGFHANLNDTHSGLTAANCLLTQGNWKEASQVYDQVVTSLSESARAGSLGSEGRQILSAALLGSGDAQARLGDWEKAAYAYNDAISLNPGQTFRNDIQAAFQHFFSNIDDQDLAKFSQYNAFVDTIGEGGWLGYRDGPDAPPPAEYLEASDCDLDGPCYMIRTLQNNLAAGFMQSTPIAPQSLFYFGSRLKSQEIESFKLQVIYWAGQDLFGVEKELSGSFDWHTFGQVNRVPSKLNEVAFFPVVAAGEGSVWINRPLLIKIPWPSENIPLPLTSKP